MGAGRDATNQEVVCSLQVCLSIQNSEQQHKFLTITESPSQITPGAEAATGTLLCLFAPVLFSHQIKEVL